MRRLLSLLLYLFPTLSLHAEPAYALATGEQDRERLTILNELYNPVTLSHLDLNPSQHVLTIGCGIALLEIEMASKVASILATDISEEQLAIARKNAQESNVENIEFLRINVDDLVIFSRQFDLIHCRFVLSHIPFERVEKIIPMLYTLVAPGGKLVIEEIATINSQRCEPPHIGYDQWLEFVYEQFAAQGSDHSPGERILEFLQKNDYPVTAYTYQPILRTPREKSILALGIRSKEHLFKKKGLSRREMEETIALLGEIERDPSILPHYCELKQMIIAKPELRFEPLH